MGQTQGRGNGQQNYSNNQVISHRAVLADVLGAIGARRGELEPLLPPDQTFEAFHATINQALRANPDLLTCEPRSLVNACVKAGYDGLRIDGKEAAIVWDMITPPGGGRKIKTARYMPMYQGLVQQVLRGGLVLACEADVIYANDTYRIIRGSNPQIIHEPLLEGDRGEMIAAYNVATLASGLRTSAYLTREQVIDIQKESKSGWKDGAPAGVWERWPREQWKKTILRQHRKTLPVGTHPIRDAELSEDFPQFDRQTPHPQFAPAAARPTRAAIANRAGTEAGEPMDFGFGGSFNGETGEVIEHGREEPREEHLQQRADPPREQEQPRQADVAIPEDANAWAAWGTDIETKLGEAKTAQDVDRVWSDAAPVMKHANKAVRDRLTGLVTKRNTDLMLDAEDGDGASN